MAFKISPHKFKDGKKGVIYCKMCGIIAKDDNYDILKKGCPLNNEDDPDFEFERYGISSIISG